MDYNNPNIILYASIFSNIVALIILWCSWKKPNVARALFALLFLWASWVNCNTALYNPGVYLDYGKYAVFPFYKDFIFGFFSKHITPLVLSVAVCQLLISFSMLLKNPYFKMGAIGGIIFLLSIAPLGVGSGFPCTLILAGGLYLLYNKGEEVWWLSIKKA
jgi:hypothetical protein